MNTLTGIIQNIQTSGQVMLIDVSVQGMMFSVILIDSLHTNDWIIKGREVRLLFKESEVSLAKDLQGMISMRNRMKSKIKRIEKGEVLSCVYFDVGGIELCSSVTTRAVHALQLQVGDTIECLVKSNEISLMNM